VRERQVRTLVAAAVTLAAIGLPAQDRPVLSVVNPRADSLAVSGPIVRATGVLADRPVRELLDHGFPARLRFRCELWSAAGWFDNLLRVVEWDLVVQYEPISRRYHTAHLLGDSIVSRGVFRELADAVVEVERPWRPPIRAAGNRATQYYNVILTLEMLSVSDLDELQRWVRGDLTPAVRGQRNPGTALSRGARTLLSRLLGGERRTLESRSRTFRVPS
jgi:hypothetical protein